MCDILLYKCYQKNGFFHKYNSSKDFPVLSGYCPLIILFPATLKIRTIYFSSFMKS